MNCQTCQIELEDFLYSELDAVQQAAINEHLSVCTACRAVQVTLEREHQIFAQFYEQNALEPSDEMWQAIHDRIKSEATSATDWSAGWTAQIRNWFAPLLAPAMWRQAAFTAVLVVLSVGLTAWYFAMRQASNTVVVVQQPPTPTPTATEVTRPPVPASDLPAPSSQENMKHEIIAAKASATRSEAKPVPAKLSNEQLLAQQINKATREYQGAIKLLERAIAQRKPELSEETLRQFEGSLALIDASIASSREAMRAHPNDPTAARFLLAAYSKKVDLMQEVAMR